MEHLKDTENFGEAFKEKDDLVKFLGKLVSWIERRIFNRISKRVNWLLDRIKNDNHEIVKDGNEIEEEGNWRQHISGDNLLLQRHDGSDWVTIDTSYGS